MKRNRKISKETAMIQEQNDSYYSGNDHSDSDDGDGNIEINNNYDGYDDIDHLRKKNITDNDINKNVNKNVNNADIYGDRGDFKDFLNDSLDSDQDPGSSFQNQKNERKSIVEVSNKSEITIDSGNNPLYLKNMNSAVYTDFRAMKENNEFPMVLERNVLQSVRVGDIPRRASNINGEYSMLYVEEEEEEVMVEYGKNVPRHESVEYSFGIVENNNSEKYPDLDELYDKEGKTERKMNTVADLGSLNSSKTASFSVPFKYLKNAREKRVKNKIVADHSLLSESTYDSDDLPVSYQAPGAPMSISQPTPVSDTFSDYFSSSTSTSLQDSRSVHYSASLPTPASSSNLNQISNLNKSIISYNDVVSKSDLISNQIRTKSKSTPSNNLENNNESNFHPKIIQKSNIISINKFDEYDFIPPTSKDDEQNKNVKLNTILHSNKDVHHDTNVDISAYVRSSSVEFESESNSELQSEQSLFSSNSSSSASSSKSSSDSFLGYKSKREMGGGRDRGSDGYRRGENQSVLQKSSDNKKEERVDNKMEERVENKKEKVNESKEEENESEDQWKNENRSRSSSNLTSIKLVNPLSSKALPWDALKLSLYQQVINSIL